MTWLDDMDHFAKAHQELMEEYMEAHPDVDQEEAYEATADFAYERMLDNLHDLGDWLHEQRRDRMLDEES